MGVVTQRGQFLRAIVVYTFLGRANMTLTPMAGYRILQTYARDPQPRHREEAKKTQGNCEKAARFFITRGIQIALEKYALPPSNDSKFSAAARRSLASLRQSLPRAYHVSIYALHFTAGPQIPYTEEEWCATRMDEHVFATTRATPEAQDASPTGSVCLQVQTAGSTSAATLTHAQRTALCSTGFAHGSIRASGVNYSFIAAVRELIPNGPCELHTFRLF